jgi:hypothetical protein
MVTQIYADGHSPIVIAECTQITRILSEVFIPFWCAIAYGICLENSSRKEKSLAPFAALREIFTDC